ncbi:MAG: helix-turn-helix domain-containing protein [Phycisphaerales bacterium]
MAEKIGLTIPELAEKLGISRVAAWTKVKKGTIPATKVGRQYIVSARDARVAAGEELSGERKRWLEDAVDRVVREYGPVLKRLSHE